MSRRLRLHDRRGRCAGRRCDRRIGAQVVAHQRIEPRRVGACAEGPGGERQGKKDDDHRGAEEGLAEQVAGLHLVEDDAGRLVGGRAGAPYSRNFTELCSGRYGALAIFCPNS